MLKASSFDYHPQNLMGSSNNITVFHNATRFHENRLKTFHILLFTDKQMDRHWWKHILLGEGNIASQNSPQSVKWLKHLKVKTNLDLMSGIHVHSQVWLQGCCKSSETRAF